MRDIVVSSLSVEWVVNDELMSDESVNGEKRVDLHGEVRMRSSDLRGLVSVHVRLRLSRSHRPASAVLLWQPAPPSVAELLH